MSFTGVIAEVHRRDRVLALGGWLMVAGLMVAAVLFLSDTRLILGINPYRLKVNRQKSLFEQQTNGVNGGGFAKYLVFVGYSHSL